MLVHKRLLKALKTLPHDDRGATMLEYGLLATLIAVAVAPAVALLGPEVAKLFTQVLGAF